MTDIWEMTPLQRARYLEEHPREDCVTCANCVKVGRAYFCEVNEKMLIPRFMRIGRCMFNPSVYKKRDEGGEI